RKYFSGGVTCVALGAKLEEVTSDIPDTAMIRNDRAMTVVVDINEVRSFTGTQAILAGGLNLIPRMSSDGLAQDPLAGAGKGVTLHEANGWVPRHLSI